MHRIAGMALAVGSAGGAQLRGAGERAHTDPGADTLERRIIERTTDLSQAKDEAKSANIAG